MSTGQSLESSTRSEVFRRHLTGAGEAAPAPAADVVLLLEGTYPYVTGGVSSWVHGIISGMPDLSFGLIFLSANYEERELKYTLPSNVSFLSEVGIYDYIPYRFLPEEGNDSTGREEALAAAKRFCLDLQEGHAASFDKVYEYLSRRVLSIGDLAYSPMGWKLLRDVYEASAGEAPFANFFWNWRFTYLSLWNLLYAHIPPARLYHAVSTGWAGYLGAVAKKRYGIPLILTEHGIYLNERRIELSQSGVMGVKEEGLSVNPEMSYLTKMWVNFFNATTKLCYERCDAIYTLHAGNRRMQIDMGAPEDMVEVIPNGVDVEALCQKASIERVSASTWDEKSPLHIGFVGRVVSIKDVKTLIRACRLVIDKLPNVEVLLMGPTDEEKEYFSECRNLVELLGLGDKVKFLGRVDVREYFPNIDVQVLTSISEGQPLVILEGYCSGVPVVATKVGACLEMVEGLEPEDRALGPSGIVTRVGNPEETAVAILKILRNPALRKEMAEAARERVCRFYDDRKMISRYRDIYETYIHEPCQ